MANKNVNIKIKADSKDAENGIKKVESSLNKLAKTLKKSPVISLSKSVSSLGIAVGATTTALKTVVSTVKDLESASLKQTQAERQLEQAAKNNPYLNSSNVSALKNYASELQKIGTIGDEELLPMMAQLAAAGRTQEEIQAIMSAALDASASGAVSMETAVTALNKSLNGEAGKLSQLVPGIKNLTKEQLQSGEAIKLVAKSYEGMSEKIAKTTGSAQQLSNAWGDFKELVGKGLEKPLSAVRSAVTDIITQINEAWSKSNELKDAKKAQKNGTTTLEQHELLLEEDKKTLAVLEKDAKARDAKIRELKEKTKDPSSYGMFGAMSAQYLGDIGTIKRETAILVKQMEEYQKLKDNIAGRSKHIADTKQKEADAQAKAVKDAEDAAALAERQANTQKVLDIQEEYNATVKNAKKTIEYRRQTGEEISEEEASQELLNTKISAYVKARQEAGALMSDQDSWVKVTTEDILAEAQALQTEADAADDAADSNEELKGVYKELSEEEKEAIAEQLVNQVYDEWNNTLENQKEALIEYGDFLKETFGENSKEYEAYKEALAKIDKQIEDNASASSKARLESLSKQLSTVKEFIGTFADITSEATSLIAKKNEAETNSELSSLQDQYDEGIISYEEYQEKKEAIEKEAAEKQYKLDLWNWGVSMLEATANTALACTKALAEGGPIAGPALATMMGVLGALQVATLAASKPTAPNYATGGIVQGNSYTGDKVRANVNSGEMILNAQQQKELWNTANGNSGGANTNIIINNKASNVVRAQPQISNKEINILIDTRVSESLTKGKLNNALSAANNSMTGKYYGY